MITSRFSIGPPNWKDLQSRRRTMRDERLKVNWTVKSNPQQICLSLSVRSGRSESAECATHTSGLWRTCACRNCGRLSLYPRQQVESYHAGAQRLSSSFLADFVSSEKVARLLVTAVSVCISLYRELCWRPPWTPNDGPLLRRDRLFLYSKTVKNQIPCSSCVFNTYDRSILCLLHLLLGQRYIHSTHTHIQIYTTKGARGFI